MRKIGNTSQFKRDYNRELKGVFSKNLEQILSDVLEVLVVDKPLAIKYKDHQLHGEYTDCSDCLFCQTLYLYIKKLVMTG